MCAPTMDDTHKLYKPFLPSVAFVTTIGTMTKVERNRSGCQGSVGEVDQRKGLLSVGAIQIREIDKKMSRGSE